MPPRLTLARHLALPPRSDRDLIRATGAGDPAAFSELARRHSGLAARAAADVFPAAADDVAQATLVLLGRKAAARADLDSVAGWVFETARRLALKARTAAARRARREARAAAPPAPTDPLDELTLREVRSAVAEEVARLPEHLRAPLLLCYWDGATRATAAARLGCSASTLRRRLDAGLDRLAARLARRGFAGAAVLAALAGLRGAGPAVARPGTPPGALPAAGVAGLSAGAAALLRSAGRRALVGNIAAAAAVVAVGAAVAVGVALPGGPVPPAARLESGPGPGAGPARVDAFGDPLPPGAVARAGTLRLRHGGPVVSGSFLPGGKHLVTAGIGDPAARVWDAAAGRELRSLGRLPDRLSALAVAPDGDTLATFSWADGRDRRVFRLWDFRTGAVRHESRPLPDMVGSLAFSPDGRLVAGTAAARVYLWEAATGRELPPLGGAEGGLAGVAFGPGGRSLATAARDGAVTVWDVAGERVTARCDGHPGGATAVAFAPDGAAVVSGGHDKAVRVWDPVTGRKVRDLPGCPEAVRAVAVSPDGRTVAAASGVRVHRWTLATGRESPPCAGHPAAVCSVFFSPDGKTLAAGGEGNAVLLWDAATGGPRPGPDAPPGWVIGVAFAPDGKTLLSASAGQPGLDRWDAATGRRAGRVGDPAGGTRAVAFARSGVAAAAGDSAVQLWDQTTGRPLGRVEGGRGGWTEMALSPDGRTLAAVDESNALHVWDTRAGRAVRPPQAFPGGVACLTFAPDGKVLATAGYADTPVVLWDAATGREIRRLEGLPAHANGLAFSPDGAVLVAGGLGVTPRLAVPLGAPVPKPPAADFSRSLCVWDVATGREVRRLTGLDDHATAVAVSPDGRTIAVGTFGGVLRVFEALTGRPVVRYDGHRAGFHHRSHRAGVLTVAFAPDGRRVATGGPDTTALVWDLSGRPAAPPTASDLPGLWAALEGEDAEAAYRALGRLDAAPELSVPWVGERLRPVARPDPARLAQLVAGLDAPAFADREAAERELGILGELAAPALRAAGGRRPSAEAVERAGRLLGRLARREPTADERRAWRAVWLLERIGTPAARGVLEGLARGAPEAGLTREAAAALDRRPR